MKPTQEQILQWAREVWGGDSGKPWSDAALLHITQLAAIAYEAGQESMKWDGIHSCHPDCQRPACVHTRKAVEAEREMCAEILEANADSCVMNSTVQQVLRSNAKAIRARGKE